MGPRSPSPQSITRRLSSPQGRRLSVVVSVLLIFWVIGFRHQWGHSPLQLLPGYDRADGTTAHPGNVSSRGNYSIKALAYVFPQFHPIPENDEFWGENFTEWTNVKQVTHNNFGLETLRPTEEVGYYNLLDYSVRARYAKLVRDSGLYGLVYHHYWFGRPVMERVLEAMLVDGQPNVPFMLNWANEPWSKRWDGNGGKDMLLAQPYGSISDWRAHFDWMLPYFRHPNYIRSGGKVQMMVYNPADMGDMGKLMFAAWRQWAIEEGLGGLDVIETRIDPDDPNSRGPADAINEFSFRSGGGLDATNWVKIDRISRTYHRSARVTWDNTPRHSSDGRGSSDVFAHPDLWRLNIVEIIRRMKLEPNPVGEENFLLINALNEWGEGNVLEPSVQWGDKYWMALRDALSQGETLPWKEDLLTAGDQLERQIKGGAWEVDVCVLVQASSTSLPWKDPFDLPHMLRSLYSQYNGQWRAIIIPTTGDADRRVLKKHVLDTFDPRITVADIPADAHGSFAFNDPADVTDWVIENLEAFSSDCASAKYMLITDSTSSYEPRTFSLAARSSDDIVGFNFVSPSTMAAVEDPMLPWEQRCIRFSDRSVPFHRLMDGDSQLVDLGAVFINLPRWREGRNTLGAHRHEPAGAARFLQKLSRSESQGWSWSSDPASDCGLVHADTYTACVRTGQMWLDVPDIYLDGRSYKPGCHSLDSIVAEYDWNVDQWDMRQFKKDAFCLRMSRTTHMRLPWDVGMTT